jgi:hypothetical protein
MDGLSETGTWGGHIPRVEAIGQEKTAVLRCDAQEDDTNKRGNSRLLGLPNLQAGQCNQSSEAE